MTREEAIKILKSRDEWGIPSGYNGGYAEAIDVAIEALEAEQKHGRWDGDTCSVCGFSWCDVTYEAPQTEMSFCPNCGSLMDEVEE